MRCWRNCAAKVARSSARRRNPSSASSAGCSIRMATRSNCGSRLLANEGDKLFAGAIPDIYDEHLVPLIFEPYALDLAARLASRAPGSVLEIAAGTGVVTRQLAVRLPAGVSIVATDLNQPMIDRAARVGTARPAVWRQADAMQLPFDDASFRWWSRMRSRRCFR